MNESDDALEAALEGAYPELGYFVGAMLGDDGLVGDGLEDARADAIKAMLLATRLAGRNRASSSVRAPRRSPPPAPMSAATIFVVSAGLDVERVPGIRT